MNKYKYLTLTFSAILIVFALSSCFLLPKSTLTKPQLLSPVNGATNITAIATLMWKPSNLSQTTYEVFIGQSASGMARVASTGKTYFVESNLNYSTTYYWKIVSMASNQAATSDTWSFTTKVSTPSKPFLSVTDLSTSSVALGWTQSKFASSLTLYRSTSTVFGKYAILSGSSTSYIVNGLFPSTAYKFFLVATNASGHATSNTVTVTTQSYTPRALPVIKSFDVTSISTNTITLGFQTQDASVVYIYSPPSKLVLATAGGNATNYTVTGLTPSTMYRYFAVAINPSGRATSGTVTATTQSYTQMIPFPIYIGDKPVSPSSIHHLYVTLNGFSIHATFGSTSTWYTSSESCTYDLTTLVGTSTKFTEITLPASAMVTQMRFEISSATIVVNGNSYPLNIPSSTIYMNMNSINAMESNGIYLDFDISRSVEQTGQGYLFKPVIHTVNGNVRASVMGSVMYNSQPILMAVVSLSNSSTVVAQTYTRSDGKFTIPAVQIGNYTLTVNASGLISYSTSVSLSKGMNNVGTINLSILPPSTPALKISTPNPYLAVLRWTQSINASGFHVWESTSPMQAYTKIATLPGTVLTYNVNIRPNTDYYFMVSAYNASGQTWSNRVATKTTLRLYIPSVQLTKSATIGGKSLLVATAVVYHDAPALKGATATIGNVSVSAITRASPLVFEFNGNLSNLPSNSYVATVTVKDSENNTYSSTSGKIYIDNTPPAIVVSLIGGTGKTTSPHTLTNDSSVTIYTNSKAMPTVGSINITDNSKMPVTAKAIKATNVSTELSFTATSGVSAATFNATTSQKYTITVSATDAFGNASTHISTFTLIVDTMPPEITITVPATVESGKTFTATITTTDLQSEVTSIVATYNGQILADPAIMPISKGYEFVFTLTAPTLISTSETYITAKVEDRAGNIQTASVPVYVNGKEPDIQVTLTGGKEGSITLIKGSNITIQSVNKLTGSISITDGGSPITLYATKTTTLSTGLRMSSALVFTKSFERLNSTFDASYYFVRHTIKILAIDPFGNKATYLATFTVIPVTVGVGNNPIGVGVDQTKHMVYVTNHGGNTVSVIDGNNLNTAPKTIFVANNPYGVGISSTTGGSTIYVSNNGNHTVSVINGKKNYVVQTVPVGNNPVGLGDPIMNMIYVANYGSNTVSMIDGKTNSVIQNINVGKWPRDVGVNPKTGMIYVANFGDNTISAINVKTNSVIQTIPVGKLPRGVGVDPTTGMIYVANSGDNTLSVINGDDLSFSTNVNVGISPWGVGIDPITRMVYVTNHGGNTVSVIDGRTNSVVSEIPVGRWPRGIAVDSTTGMIYVANFGDNTISAINEKMILQNPISHILW